MLVFPMFLYNLYEITVDISVMFLRSNQQFLHFQYDNDMLVYKTNSVWKGVTYSTDLEDFKNYLNEQIEKGIYPVDLYK